jgi:hypothetical protein
VVLEVGEHDALEVIAEDVGDSTFINARVEVLDAPVDKVDGSGEPADWDAARPRPIEEVGHDGARLVFLAVEVVNLEADGDACPRELIEEGIDLINAHTEEVLAVRAKAIALRERRVLADARHDIALGARGEERGEAVGRERAYAVRAEVHVLVVELGRGLHAGLKPSITVELLSKSTNITLRERFYTAIYR